MKYILFIIASLLIASPASALPGGGEFKIVDLAGKEQPFSEIMGKGTTVVIAVATKCPVVRKYVPVLNRIQKAWKPKGVHMVLLSPASYDDPKGLKKEFTEFKTSIPIYLDRSRELSRALSLNVTSKAVVIKDGEVVYRGAIDDRYTFDGAKPRATKKYLEDVLAALGSGRPSPHEDNRAAGCAISLD